MLCLLPLFGTICANERSVKRGGEFPMVMFSVPMDDAHFKKVKSLGFNYVHQYGLTNKRYDASIKSKIKAYLDLAQEHGLKVMMNLDGQYRIQDNNADQIFSDFKKIVNDFKDHPALGMWYLFDEPEWHANAAPEKLAHYYTYLKDKSPETPVIICFSTKEKKDDRLKYIWKDFVHETDIIAFDTYPVYGQDFPDTGLTDVTAFTDKVAKTGKPVMPALQIFNWQVISGVVEKVRKGTYHIKEAGRNPAIWRYPTTEELRFWAYSSLIQNVHGLMWWSYTRSLMNDDSEPKWMDRVLAGVTMEFSGFVSLVQEEGFQRKDIVLSNVNLLAAKWEREEESFLVIGNGSEIIQRLSDNSVLQYLNGNESIWGMTDDITIENGEVVLQPYEVVVLKLKMKVN